MALETHRRALRTGLPWLVVALILLAPSIVLPACVEPFVSESRLAPLLARATQVLGTCGSAVMLFALLQFARARIEGHTSLHLLAAFGAWILELALRLYSLSSEPSASDVVLVLRVTAVALAMCALSGGMLALLRRSQGFAELGPWHLSRALFATFLVGLTAAFGAARWSSDELDLWAWIASWPAGSSLAWIAFAAPWVALVHAVRRSVRWVARRQSVAEILTS
ncbi:MAG: hypothetical protein IT454_16590 [Planctomycetes bacterium]|nr:hypothetical protein [Planctomycetota bacterium]